MVLKGKVTWIGPKKTGESIRGLWECVDFVVVQGEDSFFLKTFSPEHVKFLSDLNAYRQINGILNQNDTQLFIIEVKSQIGSRKNSNGDVYNYNEMKVQTIQRYEQTT